MTAWYCDASSGLRSKLHCPTGQGWSNQDPLIPVPIITHRAELFALECEDETISDQDNCVDIDVLYTEFDNAGRSCMDWAVKTEFISIPTSLPKSDWKTEESQHALKARKWGFLKLNGA
jgi:hypothetical protein